MPVALLVFIAVAGQKPIDAALGVHPGFWHAWIAAEYDAFVTYFGWPILFASGIGVAVGKPPLSKNPQCAPDAPVT